MNPFYKDAHVTLYLGDCRDVLPALNRDERPTACVTDPPYQETTAEWDRWPTGWVANVGGVLPASASLWCFGSARMFLDRLDEFAGWRYGQEQLWVKHNGSGPTGNDRLVKVHEWAYHWYRGRWSDLHHEWEREPATTPNKGYVRRLAVAAPHRRKDRQNAWQDDGLRQPRSVAQVVEANSIRFRRRLTGEKPVDVVLPLVRECVPPGGLVLDPFAGSGTTGEAAIRTGRRALLIEGNPAHCQVIAQRLSEMQGVTA